MTRVLVIALLLPLAARAQLAMYAVNGSIETPLGVMYNMGNVAEGDTVDLRIRIRNLGSNSVTVTQFYGLGAGFTLDSPAGQFAMAPGTLRDFILHFSANTLATFTAWIQLNDISAIVSATTVIPPVLAILPGCSSPASLTIAFGPVNQNQSLLCNFTLQNPNTQPMTISMLTVTGQGFQGPLGPSVPFTLASGQTISFAINFTPSAPAFYFGTLAIETRSYSLMGSGFDLTSPILSFDTTSIKSSQQHQLIMSLPSPSPATLSGSVNIAFLPDTALVTDDPAVLFLATGTRSLPFTVNQGATQILIGGFSTAAFQTGTSSGRIRFTVSGPGISNNPTDLIVPPSIISLDTAIATRRATDLDVSLIGFDNTYSAGVMTFIFYSTSGQQLSPGAFRADFTSNFRSYFTSTQAGGQFQALVTFPVTGSTLGILGVDVNLTNAAGNTATQHLLFQ